MKKRKRKQGEEIGERGSNTAEWNARAFGVLIDVSV